MWVVDMADFTKDKAFARKLNLSEKVKSKEAVRQELTMQGYYSYLEKQPVLNSTQIGHKPYQCDIKLNK